MLVSFGGVLWLHYKNSTIEPVSIRKIKILKEAVRAQSEEKCSLKVSWNKNRKALMFMAKVLLCYHRWGFNTHLRFSLYSN